MAMPLRVLILEDQPADAELVVHELRRAGYDLDWRRVETENDFVAELDQAQATDVILADYTLPGFGAFDALRRVQERGLDIPFIVVTGTLSDEQAVDSLKRGASDYLLKDRLGRLGAAVQRALEERLIRQERRRAEEALRESEARYRRLVESARDVVYRYRYVPTSGFEYVSPTSHNVYGYSPEDFYADPQLGFQLLYPDARLQTNSVAYSPELLPAGSEVRCLHQDGRVVWVEQRNVPIFGEDGSLHAIDGVVRDITDRKLVEEALRASEQRFRSLADAAPIGIFETDLDDTCVYVNQRLAELAGSTVTECLGEGLRRLLCADGACESPFGAGSAIEAGTELVRERRLLRPDGTARWVRVHTLPRRSAENEVIGIVGAVADITEARLAEEEIGTRARQQAAIAQLGQRALAATEAATVLKDAVNLVAEILGLEYCTVLELDAGGASMHSVAGVGWDPALLHEPIDAAPTTQAGHVLSSGQPVVVADLASETRFTVGRLLQRYGVVSGASVIIAGSSGPYGVLGAHATTHRVFSSDDVHFLQAVANVLSAAIQREQAAEALQRSERQLRQSQKMEAVGMLAGGIAHDFNNLLTAIIGFSSLVMEQTPDDDPRSAFLREIGTAGDRAAALTRQLLTLSRQQVQQLEVLDLNAVVVDLEKLLRRVIGEDIDLASTLGAELGQVLADRGQVEQIIMNLVVNARDAMPDGGQITITTANIEREDTPEQDGAGIPVRPYVMLAVSDTGTGMDAETQARIFEPFFTTKELGRGTGLGLATVYGIVSQSHGEVQVYSEPGHGTAFKIYLPCVDQSEMVAGGRALITGGMAQGTETLLLVEDEEGVRALATTVLELCGYHVLQASRGEEAMQLCRETGDSIDLIITDVVMPGINGAELARRVAEYCPSAKVLFMSGYPGEVAVRHGVLDTGVAYLAKPFTPSEISRKVREVLDADGEAPPEAGRP